MEDKEDHLLAKSFNLIKLRKLSLMLLGKLLSKPSPILTQGTGVKIKSLTKITSLSIGSMEKIKTGGNKTLKL
jgi:hypothetical protein